MDVYGHLWESHSIDSASIPQQPCDPSVMLLIVTPLGLRASARAKQSGRGWGEVEGRVCELERENQKKERGNVG